MSRFKGPGTPYPVPGTWLFVQKFDYSAAPWRITDGKGNQQHQFLHFDTRRDALAWGTKTAHLPWATPAEEWTDADKRALMDVVLQSPGYESYLRAIGASRAYASPVGLAPVPPERVEPVYRAPVRPEPTPLYDLPDPSAATFQNRQMGVDTPPEWRLPNRLFVSDLGLSVVPMDVREQFPEGVRFYQVVDAHMGYQDAESELLRAGFGYARSWHYLALDIPEFFRDAEGHSVHRWIRLFSGGGPKNPLRVWRDETPASSRPAPPLAPPGQMKMWNPRPLRECGHKLAVEGCSDCDRGWKRLLAETRLHQLQQKRDVRLIVSDLPSPLKGLHLENEEWVFIVTPSVRGDHVWKGEAYPWQVTSFFKRDGEMIPSGHQNAKTVQEAVEKAVRDAGMAGLKRIAVRNPRKGRAL